MHEALRYNGITHAQVAQIAGMERSYVTRQLSGERDLTPEVARAVSQLLREADRGRLLQAATVLRREDEPGAAARCLAVAETLE